MRVAPRSGGGGWRNDQESFTAIGAARSDDSACSSVDDLGGVSAITQAMSAVEVVDKLKILPRGALAAPAGLITAEASPEMVRLVEFLRSDSSIRTSPIPLL